MKLLSKVWQRLRGKRSGLEEARDIAPQLRELRGLTGMSGALHEAQVLQLKAWGWGAFPHVHHKLMEIRVEPAKNDVTYLWPKAGSPPKDLPRRVAFLVEGVYQLLGPEWRVRIEGEGKLLFEGQRQTSVWKAKYERREGLREEIDRIGERKRAGSAGGGEPGSKD